MGNLSHDTTNDTRLKNFISDVRDLGRDAAQGKDSLPKLAIEVVRFANEGVISSEKAKDGSDDAKRIFEVYAEAEGKKAIHERTTNGVKANTSKVRTLIKFGEMSKVDPVVELDRAMVARKNIMDADPKAKVKPAYAAYVDLAREQLAKDEPLTDDELKAVILKPEAKDKELTDELEAIQKKLERLITGEKGLKDQDERVLKAEELIRERLAALMQESELAELQEKAAAMGLAVTTKQDAVADTSSAELAAPYDSMGGWDEVETSTEVSEVEASEEFSEEFSEAA